jgi:hypothetical protein
MVNYKNIVNELSRLVLEKYGPSQEEITPDDISLANKLLRILESFEQRDFINIDESDSLHLDDFQDNVGEEFEYEDDDSTVVYGNERFSYDYIKKVLEFRREKNPCFKSIQHNFPRVKHRCYLTNFKKYYDQGGARYEKIDKVRQFMYEKFEKARNLHLPVHDVDLKIWAIEKSRELGIDDFIASPHFILNFKKKYHIVSRKVTKIVTKKQSENEDIIIQAAKNFIIESRSYFTNYNLDNIWNTDQSGFCYEYYSQRTLDYCGIKSTVLVVNSVESTTHSYTIQPLITASGKLLPKMLLCLQESTGNEFGPYVKETLLQAPNIHITCSHSGKLTKGHVNDFYEKVLQPISNHGILLILDSWSGHADEKLFKKFYPDNNSKLMIIPPKTTSLSQPCDMIVFHQWKYFVKRIFNRVILDLNIINLKDRNNVIKMHSLVHHQLSAYVFKPLIQYAWRKPGYIDSLPKDFKTVKEICFSFTSYECQTQGCLNSVFVRCSHCFTHLCFSHFFIDFHNHFNTLI